MVHISRVHAAHGMSTDLPATLGTVLLTSYGEEDSTWDAAGQYESRLTGTSCY